VSHSELVIRSVDSSTEHEFVEVTFFGVLGMKLKTVYHPLTLANADPAQVDEILRFSGVGVPATSRIYCLALKADSGDGLVACLSYSIWLHPKELEPDVAGTPSRDSVLILRSK
jgi:hypothetical protein